MYCQKIRERRETLKAKKIRIIAASFLLFQHVLMPSVVMAIENEPTASAEITQEQPESDLSGATTEMVEEQESMIHEELPEVPKEPEPQAEVTEESPETVEPQAVPPLDESLLSGYLGRLNLSTENVRELTNHGRSSYLENILQNAINRTIDLNTAAGSSTTFAVTVPTHSLVERINGSNGWISSIATDSPAGMPDEFYTQMYYGNHSTHQNTYDLNNIVSSNSAIEVSATVTKNANYTATINFTVTRTQTGNTAISLDIRGNVVLGSTVVATQFPNIATPRKVMELNYTGETISHLTINPVASVGVYENVTVQATRNPNLPQSVIQGWFHTLPSTGSWSFSTLSLGDGWYPGYSNRIPVYLHNNNSTAGPTEFWTNATVVDTEAPTGTAKTTWTSIQANRHRDFTQEELRSAINTLSDNWTYSENIKVTYEQNLSELKPGSSYQTGFTITDESLNAGYVSSIRITIVDTLAPTGTVQTETIDLSEVTTEIPSRTDLMQFLNDDLDDNWTLPENIIIQLVDENGTVINLQNLESSDAIQTGYIRLEDERGNQSNLQEVKFTLDNEGPTGNVVTQPVDFQARRKDELTRDDLLQFFTEDPLDNTTASDQIDLSLRNDLGEIVSIVNVAPSMTVYDAKVRLQDIRGNQTEYPVNYRVIDTQAPTGSVKGTWTVFEADRYRDFTQEELRSLINDLADNWSELENIQLKSLPLYNYAPNLPDEFYPMDVTATDEAGNKYTFSRTMPKIVDTTAPTANFKNEVIDFSSHTANTFSRTDLLQFLNGDPSDNWTLPQNIVIELVDSEGNEFELDDLEFKEYIGYIRLTDGHGNQSSPHEVKFKAGDNEGPTGNVVTQPVDFQARRKDELTRDDLLQFFTEDPLDNTTASDQIDLSLRNDLGEIVSIVNVAPSMTVYDAKVRLQDIRGNQTEYPVNYRVIDTQAPTGSVKGTWTVFEADRYRDFTQEELRLLINDLADNWSELENIQLKGHHLYNLSPNTGYTYYPMDLTATDEAGNEYVFKNTMPRIVDTTAPDGTLKDPLVFTKGQTVPDAREFLDGDPTDNWSLSPDIQVEVAYENNVAFADLAVGDHGVTITLTDQAGNIRTLNSQVTILEDTSEYIDVTIPVNVSFAESKESNGIVSPTYQIQNNAERAVQVSVSSVVSQSATEKLTEIDLGVKNNLNDNQVMLISSGKNLNNRRELGTIEGHSTSFSFSLFGTVGENFDFEGLDDPLNPIYSMRLNFHAK